MYKVTQWMYFYISFIFGTDIEQHKYWALDFFNNISYFYCQNT